MDKESIIRLPLLDMMAEQASYLTKLNYLIEDKYSDEELLHSIDVITNVTDDFLHELSLKVGRDLVLSKVEEKLRTNFQGVSMDNKYLFPMTDEEIKKELDDLVDWFDYIESDDADL